MKSFLNPNMMSSNKDYAILLMHQLIILIVSLFYFTSLAMFSDWQRAISHPRVIRMDYEHFFLLSSPLSIGIRLTSVKFRVHFITCLPIHANIWRRSLSSQFSKDTVSETTEILFTHHYHALYPVQLGSVPNCFL